MTLTEFHTYQEQTFDSYIATVIRNESKNAKKEIFRRGEHEIELSQLISNELAQISACDQYDLESMSFSVDGNTIIIHDMLLGQAIASLPPQQREIILLAYFLGKSDPQIASFQLLREDAIFKRRHATLRRLKKLLEDLTYEV